MPSYRLACMGCGGSKLVSVMDERDFILKREGNRFRMRRPLPPLCLDCGGTATHYKEVK